MRAQTQEHVGRCEAATTPASQCRCRCAGRCHGRRLVADGAGREVFEALPDGDPHHLECASERRTARTTSARTARMLRHVEKLNRERRAFVERVRRRNPLHAAELEARWFTGAG